MFLTFRRHKKIRENAKKFAALIASPEVGPVVMAAGAAVFLRSVSGCVAGTTAATFSTSVGARTIKTPLLAAGDSFSVGYIERGITVTPITDFEMFVDTGLGRREKIAEGA